MGSGGFLSVDGATKSFRDPAWDAAQSWPLRACFALSGLGQHTGSMYLWSIVPASRVVSQSLLHHAIPAKDQDPYELTCIQTYYLRGKIARKEICTATPLSLQVAADLGQPTTHHQAMSPR